jgi:hypothetical protein
MKASILLFLLIFLCFSLLGQAIPDTFKIYRVEVKGMDKSYNLKGALYAVTDSSILISNSFLKEDYYSKNYDVSPILVNTIENLKVRRNGSVKKGALIGLVSGALTGIIIGHAAGDDQCDGFCVMSFSAGDKAAMAGIGLGILGVSVGAIAGSSRKYFPINGNPDKYLQYQDDLIKRSIVKE